MDTNGLMKTYKIKIKNPIMGVPISIVLFSPTQFEIVDAREVALNDKQKNKKTYLIKDADGAINGKPTYARICIKRVPDKKD